MNKKIKILFIGLLFIFSAVSYPSALTFEVHTVTTTRGTEILIKPSFDDVSLNHNQKAEGKIIIELGALGSNVQGIKNIGLTIDIYTIGNIETKTYSEEFTTVGSYITQDLTINYNSNWGTCNVRCLLTFTENIPLATDEDHSSAWLVLFELRPNPDSTSFMMLSLLLFVPLLKPIYNRFQKD
ncbi:MAG: hypothetical protein KAU62_02190 [Candidatus Heimdallarchaeota archaeon]|nr:hypothetical protein [Candidatus Heimdallarchaeota archaeon]MCG3254869.1 hypothetical protein [Candidatus Heimdallarchaeota archaeon]MCK4609944.1 hypothetical protein [Candidatus Heimdallarchaeota archaeon]